jgi:hypothetical protein
MALTAAYYPYRQPKTTRSKHSAHYVTAGQQRRVAAA